MKAEVFSKDNCPFCVKAIYLLEKNEVEMDIVKIVDDETREQLIERVEEATGQPPRTVPQIFIDGEHVGGYTELVAWFAAKDSVAE